MKDANGQKPEVHISNGSGNPCRDCLKEIANGESMLIFAYCPFPKPQPRAEIGPIFLHSKECARHGENSGTPAMFSDWKKLLIRGYGKDDRIVYGTGQMISSNELDASILAILKQLKVSYVHMRLAFNNCYQCRVQYGD